MSVASIADRIKKARLDAGLTQAKAAERLGITYQAISNYERGKSRIDTGTLVKLCDLYQVGVADILRSPAWDEEQFEAYGKADSKEKKLALFDVWGVPTELVDEYNTIKEPTAITDSGLDERLRIFMELSPSAREQALDYMRYLAEKEASAE